MIRVGVHGATGRMGRLVVDEVVAAPDLDLAWTAAWDLPADLTADVIIDFSAPEAFARLLSVAQCPVVSGTTGMDLPTSSAVPLLHAANFSVGVAVLRRLLVAAHAALPDYDIELVELHHKHKRDAPSGTALRLIEGLGTMHLGHDGLRIPGVTGVHSVRGGDIVGEHRAYLCGPGERIELAHVATSRAVFAAGAVRAARWILGKPPGVYTLEDTLA